MGTVECTAHINGGVKCRNMESRSSWKLITDKLQTFVIAVEGTSIHEGDGCMMIWMRYGATISHLFSMYYFVY